MGFTDVYKLGFLEPFQDDYELDMDEVRFRAIESQLQWIFSLFGNGVLDDDPTNPSWHILPDPTDESGTRVLVTSGHGHIAWMAAETTSTATVNLPPPLGGATTYTYYIYATAEDTTPSERTTVFKASTVEITDTVNYVGLGQVVIVLGDPVSVTVYNDADHGRVEISLFAALADIINKHKHIGGSKNPSPIDLGHHVQGKLSGDFIESLDLSTVTKGTLSAERLPLIDHNTLTRRGTLTHPQIDSLLAQFVAPDGDRLPDLEKANLMQTALALKKQVGLGNIDENWVNTILYVPGVTPDSYMAWKSTWESDGFEGVEEPYIPSGITLATVDKIRREVRGTTASPMQADTRFWTTDDDFNLAVDAAAGFVYGVEPTTENIEVVGVGIDGAITIDKPVNYDGLATTDLTPWEFGYTFIDQSGKTVVSPPPTTHKFDDTFIVRRDLFYEFDSTKDWTERTHLGIGFGYDEGTPGDLFAYLLIVDGANVDISQGATSTTSTVKTLSVSDEVVIRSKDDSSPSTDLYSAVDISSFGLTSSQRSQVMGIGFYWETTYGWDKQDVEFYLVVPDSVQIDNERVVNARETANPPDTTSAVFVWNEYLYNSSARLVMRLDSSNSSTQYNALTWDIESPQPAGTRVTFYTRTADTLAELGNYYEVPSDTHYVSGSARTGRYCDVIVEMRAASDLLDAPQVNSVTLSFDSVGTDYAKTWDKAVDQDLLTSTGQRHGWNTGREIVNITIGPDVDDDSNPSTAQKNYLTLTDYDEVGRFLYVRENNAYASFDTDGDPEDNYHDGGELYQTPVQVWNRAARHGFEEPRDMNTLEGGNVVFADTLNDRVVEVDADGVLVRAIQGNIRLNQTTRDFVALTAVYNSRASKLWIAFSQNLTVLDRAKIFLVSSQLSIPMDDPRVSLIPFDPIDEKTATLQATFNEALNTQLSNLVGSMRVVIGAGAVEHDSASGGGGTGGSDGGGGSGSGDGGSGGGSGLSVGAFSDGLPSGQYEILGTGTLAGDLGAFDGLIDTNISDGLEGDFDDDGIVTTSVLLGPDARKDVVEVPVYVGDVVFDNLFSPVSVHITSVDKWVVANASSDSVVAYNTSSERLWTISSSLVSMRDGKGGSAYELDNGNVLIAAPAKSGSTNGTVMVINRQGNDDIPVVQLSVSGDAVRALPYSESILEYWVVLDDIANDGQASKLVRLDSNGKVKWAWGAGTLTHPTGLRVLTNGNVLVSE